MTRKHVWHLGVILATALAIASFAFAASNIDDAKPAQGAAAESTPIRGNFSIAKSEITALQNKFPTSTDHGIARYDGTTGSLQDTNECTIDDAGKLVCTVSNATSAVSVVQTSTGKLLTLDHEHAGGAADDTYFWVSADGTIDTLADSTDYALQVGQTNYTAGLGALIDTSNGTNGGYEFRLTSAGGQCSTLYATNDNPKSCITHARFTSTGDGLATAQTIATTTDKSYIMETRIIGRRTAGTGSAGDSAMYIITYAPFNVSGTVGLLGGVTQVMQQEAVGTWGYGITYSGANILVQVDGDATTDITWHITTTIYGPVGT